MRETTFDERGSMVRWVDIAGRLPARVFLHGLGSMSAATLARIACDPALGDHRTILVDLPGHGLSDRPSDFGYTLDDHAGAVVAVCRAAGVDAIDLVGHSLGGDVAIVAAGKHPGLAGRLVVAEANLDPLPRSSSGARASQRIAAQSEADFLATGYASLIETYPRWVPTLRIASPIAVYRSAVGLVSGSRPTMRELFTAMRIPRTFVVGDRGEELLDADGLRAAGVEVTTIGDAGHMMMDDQPEAFVAAIARGLNVA